jgi:glycolate oxidase iron-sulfur subunit
VQPAEAELLGARKADDLRGTGAQIAVSANIGCSLQLRRHLDPALPVLHPMQLLAQSAGLP